MSHDHIVVIEKNKEHGTAEVYLDGHLLTGVSRVSFGDLDRDSMGNPESITITLVNVSVEIGNKAE